MSKIYLIPFYAILLSLLSCLNNKKPTGNKDYPYIGLVRYLERYEIIDCEKYVTTFNHHYVDTLLVDENTIYIVRENDGDEVEHKWSKSLKMYHSGLGYSINNNTLYEHYGHTSQFLLGEELKIRLLNFQDVDTNNSYSKDNEIFTLTTSKLVQTVYDTIIDGLKHKELKIYDIFTKNFKKGISIKEYQDSKILFSKQYGIVEYWGCNYDNLDELMIIEKLTGVDYIYPVVK